MVLLPITPLQRVLLVEQQVHLALEFADRGYVLAHGELALHRPAAELRADRALLVSSYMGESKVEEAAAAATPSPVGVSSEMPNQLEST